MNSSLSSLSRLLRCRLNLPPPEAPWIIHVEQSPWLWMRSYCTKRKPKSSGSGSKPESVTSLVLPLGHPSISISPELDRWVHRGKPLRSVELQHLVRELRKRRRYSQALEILPVSIKSLAGSVATLANWLTSFAIAMTANLLLSWSSGGTFTIYTIVSALSIVFVVIWVPETKGRTLEEIQWSFR